MVSASGSPAVQEIYLALRKFMATAADLEALEALCAMVKATSLCGLGQAAPNPVLSTLRHFRQEYSAAAEVGP